jgi:hypothetical protein
VLTLRVICGKVCVGCGYSARLCMGGQRGNVLYMVALECGTMDW